MRCKEARLEHDKLISIKGKLQEQDTWLARRIGEAGADVEHLDLMDKLITEQMTSNNRLREIKGKLGRIERRFGFLKNEAI